MTWRFVLEKCMHLEMFAESFPKRTFFTKYIFQNLYLSVITSLGKSLNGVTQKLSFPLKICLVKMSKSVVTCSWFICTKEIFQASHFMLDI